MFRRLVRARRRVPIQSAGHESADRSDKNESVDVYHACINGDGPVPLLVKEELARERLKKARRFETDSFRDRARNLVAHVNQEERNATQAWSRLRQLYSVFEAIQVAQNSRQQSLIDGSDCSDSDSDDSDDGDDDALAELLASGDANDTILHDFHTLTANLPEGFTSAMFADLGNALYSEMVVSSHQPLPPQQRQHTDNGISREAFATVGAQLYASQPSSSSISSVVVSA